MTTVISVENLSKSYRLGQIGTGTFAQDLAVWWARMRGKPSPLLKIGQVDDGNHDGEELWALRDVSFTVQQGEVLGIIGRNGAGKSTLLKILSRVTAPTSGVIKVKGRVASLLEVGTGFHPELTGRENVYLNGAILGMSREEVTRKFDEIVDFAGVEKFIDTPVKRYSSGMYVRLAFAVAAHLEPEIMVVDEVLAVGDAEFQKKCLGKMGEVAQGGRTVLFVSHNMATINNLCKSACWFDQGKIRQTGPALQVVQNYLSGKSISSSQNLSSHTGRLSDKNPLLSHVSMFKDGNETDNFFVNDIFALSVECRANVKEFPRLALGFVVSDRMGNRIFATNTLQYGTPQANRTGHVRFNAKIDRLFLSPGFYSVSLYLLDGNRDVDIVEDAIRFEVLWNPTLALRFPPLANWGPAFTEVQWNAENIYDEERL